MNAATSFFYTVGAQTFVDYYRTVRDCVIKTNGLMEQYKKDKPIYRWAKNVIMKLQKYYYIVVFLCFGRGS